MKTEKSLKKVIVNWYSGSQLVDAVASIARHHHNLVSSVIIVDNISADNSLARVESLTALPFSLHIIRNTKNQGFGAACNQGAKLCNSDYLLFLNPDTQLFENSLSVPHAFMEGPKNRDVGICGVQLVDENGNVARTCARFPTLLRFAAQAIGLDKIPNLRSLGVHMAEWDHSSDKTVDHVIGAFFFTRRTLFEVLGGFDERFFVYLEDIDFSSRAKQEGWKTIYLTGAQAFHQGGGTSRQVKATRLFYSLRSRLLYGFKHFPRWQAWILLGLMLLIEPLSRSIFSLLRGGMRDVRNTWSGYSMLYRDLPNIISES